MKKWGHGHHFGYITKLIDYKGTTGCEMIILWKGMVQHLKELSQSL